MKKMTKIESVDLSRVSFNYDDIVDSNIVKNELSIKFGIYSFLHNENVSSHDALQGLWTSFVSLYGGEIERINDALLEEYEILDNYNGNTVTTYGEKTTINGTKTITNVFGEVNGSITHGATSVTMGGGTDTNTLEKANSESSSMDSFLKDERNTQVVASRTNSSNEYTDTNNQDERTDTSTDSGNTITENSHTISEVKHGNLGVTTSQQMLTSELKLRATTNFYDIVIKMFLNRYFFICE